MEYIRITKENIDKEHICCAMSGKQSLAKKEWLKQRFEEGLVFYTQQERGKCFIEYIPARTHGCPLKRQAGFISTVCGSGLLKGHGYSSELLERSSGCQGAGQKRRLYSLLQRGRKREFAPDPKFLNHKGFKVSDISDCGINLMICPCRECSAIKPRPAPSIPRVGRKTALSSTIPTSAPTPIIAPRCRRLQGNTDSVQCHPHHQKETAQNVFRTWPQHTRSGMGSL